VDGHVRFQIPARICNVDVAKAITDGISGIDGIYRVNLYRSQQKLSIRFNESVCDFKSSLARRLSENTNENLAARISFRSIFMAQP